MSRPSEFQQRNPVHLDISRSKFHFSPRWSGTMMSYRLTPIGLFEVIPGDTFKMSLSFVCRMSTPVAPVMDDLWLDISYYFVPNELILSRQYMSPSVNDSNRSWLAFIGAQDSYLNTPVPDGEIELPCLVIYDSSGYVVRGIADCFGMPPAKSPSGDTSYAYRVNPLAALGFMAIWNDNYRDPNSQQPGVYSISDGVVYITWGSANLNNSNALSQAVLPNVCRFHGYFGSALPWPQRNNDSVDLPLGTNAPLYVDSAMHSLGGAVRFGLDGNSTTTGKVPLNFYASTGTAAGAAFVDFTDSGESVSAEDMGLVKSSNLMVDLANASAVSINVFRLAVQEQRWYEALARGGNRIDELTAALFGVMPKDAGNHSPEYLGGKRIPLQVSQVNATANSSTEGTKNNTVGSTGAFSLTADSDYYFTKSFDKWGLIHCVACIRYRDSFGFSLNRMHTRHERFDFYFPQFANLGEQPVYKHELSIDKNSGGNGPHWPISDVFGYQEAWADYRTVPDIVTGDLRPGQSMSYWTYANNTSAAVSGDAVTAVTDLSNFIAGVYAYKAIDRTLQVSSGTSGFQFLLQVQHDVTAVRPMPLYSIPGLVDHH